MPVPRRHLGRELGRPQPMVDLRLLERAAEPTRVEDGGEVEQRSHDGGDRDAVVRGDLTGGEAPVVDQEALAVRAAADAQERDLDDLTGGHYRPQLAGGAVAQRALEREGGCQPAGLSQKCGVADGVHAPVDPVQPPLGDEALDHPSRQAERCELPPRYEPVLARGERGDAVKSRFCTHAVQRLELAGVRPLA